jgi:pimeloyl-ACP methyl ester carboxylesterase
VSVAPFAGATRRDPAVVCLHASGGSSRQWDPLARRLHGARKVLAVDLAGHGGSPGWTPGERPTLAGEAARLAPLVAAEGRVHLVGHSYGAAVAVRLALALPGRVAGMCLYEPVLFRLLLDHPDQDRAGGEIVRVAGEIRASLDAGDGLAAARRFYDYWSGAGAWHGVAPAQRDRIAARMPAVMDCFDALFGDATRPAELARLDVPVLLMSGTASTAAALGAVRHLAAALPRVRRRAFPGVGHMGPVTHAAQVNDAISGFLAETAHGLPCGSGAPPFAPAFA